MNDYVYEIGKELGYEPLSRVQTEESCRKILYLINDIETVIKDKRETVELAVLCLIADDCALIEDIPDAVMKDEKTKKVIYDIIGKEKIRELSEASSHVVCTKLVAAYIVSIVEATRNHPDIKLGSSYRGSIALFKLGRAHALFKNRNYVLPDDIIYLAPFALGHKIILTHAAVTAKKKPVEIIKSIVKDIVVPVDPKNGGIM